MRDFKNITESNKSFIKELIEDRKPLKDFPERLCEDFVLHEPSFFPFGGIYRGMEEYEKFVHKAMEYYDYSKFEFIDIYADGDVVFAVLKVGIKDDSKEILLCEQFVFQKEKIAEIRVFIFN